MKTWKKAVLWSAVMLTVAAGGAGTAMYVRTHRTPDWYADDDDLTAEQRASAANRVEDVLARMTHWSALRHARGRAAPAAAPTLAEPATDDPFPLDFTDAQLNAVYDKWSAFQDRRAAVEKYVHNPRVAVRDGHLIVAGQVRSQGDMVVSLFLDPSTDPADGRVRLTLTKVMAGLVELPDSFTKGQRKSLAAVLAKNLPANQAKAAFTADGLANGPAARAAMIQLLLGVLGGHETEPVLFVPVNSSPDSPMLPVRISKVEAHDHKLSMTAQAVPPAERPKLLEQIKRPVADDDAADHS